MLLYGVHLASFSAHSLPPMASGTKGRVLLAYSGGLGTSDLTTILRISDRQIVRYLLYPRMARRARIRSTRLHGRRRPRRGAYTILVPRSTLTSTQDFEAARKKALTSGATKFFLEVNRLLFFSRSHRTETCHTQDMTREFVTELIYPAVQANCIYEVRVPLRRRS